MTLHSGDSAGIRTARALVCAALVVAPVAALAQAPTDAQAAAIRQSCRSDYMKHCSSVPTGGAASLACLREHAAEVSAPCRQALDATKKPAPAKPSTGEAAKTPPASAAARPTWPQTINDPRGSATIYQPQVVAWPDRRTLDTRIALAITPAQTRKTMLGTIEVSFATDSDLATRTVRLSSPRLTSVRFPASSAGETQRFEERIRATLAAMGDRAIPLDSILISLNGEAAATPQAPVKNDPPAIHYSSRPASLLVFDGEPVMAPVAGTPLSVAVNTNWDVFADSESKTWYWLNNGAWLSGPSFKGPWVPASALPRAFSSLPADANFAAVRKQVPGRRITAAAMPTIFVSTLPAEIIVTDGAPRLASVPGTSLRYVTNTDANLFVDSSTNTYYYLVSGRWFSASQLDGPWIFATPSLPADFARIPANGPRGAVLVSVPGTPQAREAVLQAQVPTQATLERSTTKIDVVYTGAPKFETIAGTTIAYAVNTNYDVLRVGDKYYVCQHAAWFVAPTPTGVFVLADSVPEVVYTIPSSSPLYRVTYVRVYSATPTTVVYGYTAGYSMAYVSSGVVVYGTGYYYPPVIWPGPVPIYYPYPYSYAGSVWYNPTTGAWARGGTVYGPYGGAATGGSAYNPQTGAWAHGGAVYGPNGGAGAWSAYNPSTGGYAHGSASWGTNSGTANANWYNGRTGISGSTNQNYNQYGSWGSSTFSGANKTVSTQHQSNDRGSAGSFSSSTGAKGAGVKGDNGNSAGIAKGAGGNVYAGADGNVYRKTSDGWSKWDDGSWNPVDKSTAKSTTSNARQNGSGQPSTSGSANQERTSGSANQERTSGSANQPRTSGSASGASRASASGGASRNLSGQTERGSAFRSRGSGSGSSTGEQLDRDFGARTGGAERQQRFAGASGHALGGGGGGRFRR